MPGTLNVSVRIDHVNGALKLPFNSGTVAVGQTGLGGRQAVQIIGTSAEAIDTTDISTLGVFVLQNLDSTNYVEVGPDNSGTMVPLMRLKAGEVATFRSKPGITIKAQANTASVKLLVIAYEN